MHLQRYGETAAEYEDFKDAMIGLVMLLVGGIFAHLWVF